MTQVSIIEVDLSEEVETIIDDEIREITGEERQRIDAVREASAMAHRKASEDKAKKDQITDVIEGELKATYEALLKAGDDGLTVDEVVNMTPSMTTTSAFTLRMKTFLRKRGNPYAIVKKTVNRRSRYTLIKYNGEEPADQNDV